MTSGLLAVSYIGASILFILSLGGLSHQETARRGNLYGIAGMILAIVATALARDVTGYEVLIPAIAVGGAIGIVVALKVEMTGMPQLVGMLNSLVGLAAVLVAVASHFSPPQGLDSAETVILAVEICLGVLIGTVTFTGSMIAFAKLQGILSGRPLLLPGRNGLNLVGMALLLWLGWEYLVAQTGGASAFEMLPTAARDSMGQIDLGVTILIVAIVLSGLIGIHFVLAIGGADMPVVVSMLNSYSGWAAAAPGSCWATTFSS